MDQRLGHYIWTHTKRQQIWILFIVALSMIPYFLSFDLPKQIVNGPIQGKGFETAGATQTFMRIDFDMPLLGHVVLFNGLELNRLQTLFALSLVFLLLVVINGLFKLYINTYKGRLGERLLRRIRFELVDRILRFPPSQFKRVKGAELASMIKDEVEPLGGFTGDAFVQPALLGGQALTALIFIFMQHFWLGMVAAIIVAVQAVLIPRMRQRLLVLGRQRQITARELSGRVSEIVEGIATIHAYDTSNYERADISARLGRIFKIRYDLYQWKFLVKFINNFLAQVTPFLFYCIGGYLALNGRLDVGQLVAVINAYKDLPGPLKDLIDWDQTRQDVQVKYVQVVEQFQVDRMMDPSLQALSKAAGDSRHPLAAVNLSLVDDSGARLMERVSLQIAKGERVAIIGGEALAEAAARILAPEAGRIALGGDDIWDLPESLTGRRISYAASDVYLFSGTLGDNLFYGLKHAPLKPPTYDGEAAIDHKWALTEARLAGNPEYDIKGDWIDYAEAGADGPDKLFRPVRAVLDAVQLSNDIFDLALRSTFDPARHPQLADHIVDMRSALRVELEQAGLRGLVSMFEADSYNREATVGENLLFGTATGLSLKGRAIGQNPYFRSVMDRTGLGPRLFRMGYEIAENAVELFADLPPDHPFFQQLTFMTPDDIPEYQQLLQKLQGKSFEEASDKDRYKIIKLSFAYIEPRHRFGLLNDELMAKIVEARHIFHDNLPEELESEFERYDAEKYMASASLLDNVLIGRISHKHADGAERVRAMVRNVVNKQGLYDDVLAVGLDFDVGAGGRRLAVTQRQKLGLARALIRRSDYYLFNRPLPGLDHRLQDDIVHRVLELVDQASEKPALIWVLSNPSLSGQFDRVVVFDRGVLTADGPPETLAEKAQGRKERVSS